MIDAVLVPENLPIAPPADDPARLIELAIERGAPLFNDGQTAACAALYELTARALLLLDDERITDSMRTALRNAVTAASRQSHAATQAWTLRRTLDLCRFELRDGEMAATAATTEIRDPDVRRIFEFAPNENEWFSVNDDVMGGISRGGFEQVDETVGAFRGALSLENNGGFSTIRSRAKDLDLGADEGLEMRVRGDGRTYSVRALTSDRRSEARSYRASFETKDGEWQAIRVPFSALELSVMGRRFPGRKVDPAEVRSLGFSISDKNETPFNLEIDWIGTYR